MPWPACTPDMAVPSPTPSYTAPSPLPFFTFLSLFFLFLRFRLGITSNSRRSKVPSVTSTVSSSPAGLSSSSPSSSSGAEGGGKTGAEAPHKARIPGLREAHPALLPSTRSHPTDPQCGARPCHRAANLVLHCNTRPSLPAQTHLLPWLNSPLMSFCWGSTSAFCRLFCQLFQGDPVISSTGVSFPGSKGAPVIAWGHGAPHVFRD